MGCLLCSGSAPRWRELKGHWIVECTSCGHRQAELLEAAQATVHADAHYGDAYFTEGGAGYTDYHAEADLLRRRGQRYGRILAKHTPPGRILDVGAAAGYLMEGYAQAGWTAVGIEPNDTMAAHARARGVDVRTGIVTEEMLSALTIEPDSFDAVAVIQVIAHVIDPNDTVRVLAERLRVGGLLLIETWNRGSRTARVFGERWHEYSPPSVVHWFRPAELDGVAERAGLVKLQQGRMAKQIAAGHAASLLAADSPNGVAAKVARVIPKRLVLPYPAEDLFWSLYQRSR
jgi:SAM-dependent methyltransferase